MVSRVQELPTVSKYRSDMMRLGRSVRERRCVLYAILSIVQTATLRIDSITALLVAVSVLASNCDSRQGVSENERS